MPNSSRHRRLDVLSNDCDAVTTFTCKMSLFNDNIPRSGSAVHHDQGSHIADKKLALVIKGTVYAKSFLDDSGEATITAAS